MCVLRDSLARPEQNAPPTWKIQESLKHFVYLVNLIKKNTIKIRSCMRF